MKKFLLPTILIAIFLSSISTYTIFNFLNKKIVEYVDKPVPTPIDQVYKNDDLGFGFSYPGTWTIDSQKNASYELFLVINKNQKYKVGEAEYDSMLYIYVENNKKKLTLDQLVKEYETKSPDKSFTSSKTFVSGIDAYNIDDIHNHRTIWILNNRIFAVDSPNIKNSNQDFLPSLKLANI